MGLPIWVVSLVLFAWGWRSGTLLLAGPLALVVWMSAWVRHRSPLSNTEFHRVLDVCWVLGAGGFLLIYSRESVGNILRSYFGWLPVIAYPALLAQVWSTRGTVPASALLPLPGWRRRVGEENPDVDLRAAFVLLCLVSASVTGSVTWTFYPVLAGVVGLILWMRQPRTVSRTVLAGLLGVSWLGGWSLSLGLTRVQPWLENRVMEWTAGFQRPGTPGAESRTAIGRRGRVGGSGRVVLKVRGEGLRAVPRLLRTAVFSIWQDGSWYALRSDAVKIEGSADEWRLDAHSGRAGAIEAEWVSGLTEGLVPLPAYPRVLRDLLADTVERTAIGTVRADVQGGMATYRVEYAARDSWESAPSEEERSGIPPLEVPAVQAVVEELGLAGLPGAEVTRRLEGFFTRRFRYSRELSQAGADDPRARSPLGRFLLGHRTGHCEYFATAAVLILRAAGVPARYVTGFAVNRSDRQGDLVTVREADAHAWVRVWLDGGWVDFDPTPASGFGLEEDSSGGLGRWARTWHELRYGLVRWWWLGEKQWLRQAYWLAVPLLAVLVWRFRQLRVAAGDDASGRLRPQGVWPGLDSEWFDVERALAGVGWERRPGEPEGVWARRLADAGWAAVDLEGALGANRLHQRHRFDPQGLGLQERENLRVLSASVGRRIRQDHGEAGGGASQR